MNTTVASSKCFIALALFALCIGLLVGCGGGNGSSMTIDSTASEGAADAAGSEAQVIATSMTPGQVTASAGAQPEIVSDSISGCPSVDVKSTGSGGTWTDEVLTFANPPCGFTGTRGYVSLGVTGTIELMRSATNSLSFSSNVQNLKFAFSTPNATYSETRNGTRDVTATATSASATNNITVDFAGAKYDGTFQHQMEAKFTPASGSTLLPNEPLPSGSFNFSGSAQWTGSGGADDTFTVTTTKPLEYDANCKDTQPSVFDSGVLQLQGQGDKSNSYATITWSNCGTPMVAYASGS